MSYEQFELPDWIVNLQVEVDDYKEALMRIAQTPRINGKCPYCTATTTEIGGDFVKNTAHEESCPVSISEKALS